jgi:NAD(P)H-dependent FMN reductase
MHVVAINTDPEKDWGVINILLAPLLEGLREAGASVELYYSRDLLIFPCCGNLNCTVATPGKCMAYDDMRWLREKIGQADVLVLASPQYFNGFTGQAGATGSTKLLLDRLARSRDLCDKSYEHAIHTTREPVSLGKVVVVSGCGFVEIDEFYPVLTHLKAFCYNTFPELAGCITGDHPVKVRDIPQNASATELMAIARAAGRELMKNFHRPSARATPPVACDGGKAATGTARVWEAVTLFEYNMPR